MQSIYFETDLNLEEIGRKIIIGWIIYLIVRFGHGVLRGIHKEEYWAEFPFRNPGPLLFEILKVQT